MTIPTKAPRWYSWKDGVVTPCYELPKKSGNGMKACSLREARELKLLPSVTSVLSVIDKPELDNWRVSQAIHSALTLPRGKEEFNDWKSRLLSALPRAYDHDALLGLTYTFPPRSSESEDAFAERVLDDAEAQAAKAAEFGTRIHDAIAQIMQSRMHVQQTGSGLAIKYEKDLDPFVEGFISWANENIEEVHAVEKCVGHPSIGVAGRMDLECTLKGVGRCVCDFKTQAVKEGKAQFWRDWGPQLAAYSMCLDNADRSSPISWLRQLVSVVIPSNEPGPVSVKVYDEPENMYQVFMHALELWIYTRGNGYDPRQHY